MFSTESAITYLVHKKFGIIATLAPTFEMIQKNKNINAEKSIQTINIESYEKSLRALPASELEKKYHQAVASDAERARQNAVIEEKSWCFNLPSANADFVHWAKAAHWTIDEAIALSFGKEPEHVTWQKIEPLKDKTTFAKVYAKRRDLALRATRWKKFGDTIPPVIFISWAKEINIELPNALIEEVTKIGAAINWHEQYLKVKAERDELAAQATNTQKPESARKIDNLLQAIAAIAIYAYKHDVKSVNSNIPKDIADDISKSGKTIDVKTVREWIKEGVALLPVKPRKD